MKDLGKRTLTAIIAIPIAVFIILHGGILFALAITIISTLALFEFYSMAEEKGMKPLKIPMLTVSAIYILFLYFFISESILKFDIILSFIIPVIIAIYSIGLALWQKEIDAFRDISISIAGVIYVSFSLASLICIREFGFFRMMPGIDWGAFIMTMFVAIWICDSAAYFIGSAIGKNKLFPRHSPNKSWEGAIAGFIFGTATFVLGLHWFNEVFVTSNAVIMGMIISGFCQLGDLAESHFKRSAGVKDSSNLFPGHGGFLDRFDGIIFVSPIIFLYLLLVY